MRRSFRAKFRGIDPWLSPEAYRAEEIRRARAEARKIAKYSDPVEKSTVAEATNPLPAPSVSTQPSLNMELVRRMRAMSKLKLS